MKINTKIFSSINYRSIIFGIVIFASVLAFLFTGFGRIGSFSFKNMDPNIALIVGKQNVSMSEFSNLLTAQGYSNAMPDMQKKYLASQILQNLISQKLLLEEAEKLGFSVSQDDISVFLRSLSFFHDPDTKQFSFERLKKYLSSQQMSEVEFFQTIRDELTIRNIKELLVLPVVYPTSVAKTQYDIDHTEFYLKYALLNINPKSLNEKINQGINEFLNDPKNEDELKNLYKSKETEYNQPTKYKVRSILIAYQDAQRAQGDALARSKADAQVLIDDVLKKIQNGADFKTLAAQKNDDARALQNAGDLGFIDSTNIDSSSYEAIAKLSLSNPISSVIDTPYGFRVFKLEDKKNGFVKSFDDAKSELAQIILRQRLQSALQLDFENKVKNIIAHPEQNESLDAVLAGEGIFWKSLEAPLSTKSSVIPDLGSSDRLIENLFTLKKAGDILPIIVDFSASKHAIFRLVSIRKANQPSLSDIKSLQKQVSDTQSQEFIKEYLKGLKETYESKGKIKINPVIMQ